MPVGKRTSKSKHRKNKKKSRRQKYREPSSVALTQNKKSKRVHKLRKTTKYDISSDEEDVRIICYIEYLMLLLAPLFLCLFIVVAQII